MKLTYEDQTAIPEDSKDSFVEFKEGDKTVFMHKDLADSKKQAYRLQGDLTTQKTDLEGLKERLSTFEEDRKKALEEAEKKRNDKLIANNQHDEIISDLKSKLSAAEQEKLDIDNKWRGKYNSKQKDAIVNELSSYATDSSKTELKRLISMDLSFNDEGEVVIIGDDGKATASTLDEYKNSISSGEKYPSLIKAVSSQGGNGQGSNGVGSQSKAQFGAKIPGFSGLPKN